MELTNENVNNVFMDCLFEENTPENLERAVKVGGIMSTFGFDPDKIEKYAEDIGLMLKQLPDQFQEKRGGGWSFLNSCNRSDGTQWTGLHRTMEQLMVIGIAAGWAEIQAPREMWPMLPGGMPYFVVYEERKTGGGE